MTATSVCSLSADPPRLVACVNRLTKTHVEFIDGCNFGVNILAAKQRRLAISCSVPGSDKSIDERALLADPDLNLRSPAFKESLAFFDCEVAEAYEASTHTIFVGDIRGVWLNPVEDTPLMYWGGLYGRLESEIAQAERFHWEI
jgi:flavin reductase (DIM6/NTAB) family NADH-FMN oxidoreductase RutF